MVPLKHLVAINERVLPENTVPDRRFRYIDISSVGHGVLSAAPQEIAFGEAPSRARRLLRPGDTIVSTVRTYLRAVWPVTGDTHDLVASTGFAVLTPRRIDPRYLSWWVRSNVFIEEVVARSVGVSYPAINPLELGQLPVRLKSIGEQRAIADFLDTETARIEALITKKRRMISLLSERAQSAIDDAMSQSGETVAVRRVLSRLTSGPRGWSDLAGETGMPFIRITNISRSGIELDHANLLRVEDSGSAEAMRTKIRNGDVLVSITADIGSVAIAREDTAGGFVSQHVALMTPEQCEGEWLAYAIKSTDAQHQLDAGQYGGTKTQLSLGDLAALRISLPPPAVRKQLLEHLRAVLTLVDLGNDALVRQVGLLAEHRQALITAAVTGELDIPGVAA